VSVFGGGVACGRGRGGFAVVVFGNVSATDPAGSVPEVVVEVCGRVNAVVVSMLVPGIVELGGGTVSPGALIVDVTAPAGPS